MHGIGNSYRDMHLQDKAIESYQRALHHNPMYEPSCKALVKLMMDGAYEQIKHGQYLAAAKQFKCVLDRIEQFKSNKISEHLRQCLHEFRYKSLCQILQLIELDLSLDQEFPSLGNRVFLELTQEKEYRVQLETEDNYSALCKHWQPR